jgi:hypothetical protein
MTKIYLVENCYGDSNKVYIGKTRNSRIGPHKRTYGKNITYTIIDYINSLNHKDWKPLESYWIEQFRQWGFDIVNKRKKGGMGPEFLSKESREKKSKSMIGKTHSRETCLKMSLSKIGKPLNHGNILRQSKKGKSINLIVTSQHKELLKEIKSISITQYNLQGNFIKEWNSTQEAASFYNIQKGHICNALNGRSKSSKGFIWKYNK